MKPKNILVPAQRTLLVVVLGRSFVPTLPQTPHSIRGTVSYAFPKILPQTGTTSVADVFSLGLIVYEWANGELPHTLE